MKKFTLLLAAVLMVFGRAAADEGMWMLPFLQKMNIKDMKAMGLKLSAQDIYNINGNSLKDAIVIFGGGCTGEVVSSQGLILTNHHCGYGAIQQHSTLEHDYLKDGFWAMNMKEEIPTPGLSVTFIREIRDVTDQIIPYLNDNMTEEERNAKVSELSVEIVKGVTMKGMSQTAAVRSFFGGNQFFLIISEVYRDVRMVGAPPSSIGKFGGDTDNWMWPRHTGDFSVFRVYTAPDGSAADYSPENIPYQAPVHLKVSAKGVKEGDFAMIMGFPGSTQRYMTSYEIDYLLEVDNPTRIYVRGERQDLMMEDMLADDLIRIQYATKFSGSSNYWKNSIGKSQALKKLGIKEQKEAIENQFQLWMLADMERVKKYGSALPIIKETIEEYAKARRTNQFYSEAVNSGIEIYGAARTVSGLYNADGQPTGREENVKRSMESFYKNYSPSTDRKITKRMIELVRENIEPAYQPAVLGLVDDYFNGNIDAAVDFVFDNSFLASQAGFEAFMRNPSYERLSQDPAIIMYNEFSEAIRRVSQEAAGYNRKMPEGQRLFIAGLMEMNKDSKLYPDANFTMRLTYGQVLPYDPADGVTYHYYTTLKGVMQKEDPENQYEFEVTDRLKELYAARDYGKYGMKDGVMPVNFITNSDITGGNSGSPVLNARGELIGLAFDGNWEAMSGDIAFEPELQRCINVDVRYVLFIIDKYAGAKWLIDEMDVVW